MVLQHVKREESQSCNQVSLAQDWVLPALLTLISTSTTRKQLSALDVHLQICSCELAECDQGSKMHVALQSATSNSTVLKTSYSTHDSAELSSNGKRPMQKFCTS